ncbi:MAG: hypothetical protein I8H82_06490 [Rhodocyclales bacterium]|nr:hypothetical protein [Rhodocyclales bacterium]
MPAPFKVCPKCGHLPPQPLGATDACPACGVHMHKWPPQRVTKSAMAQRQKQNNEFDEEDAAADSWRAKLLTLPGKDAGDPAFLAVRAAVLLGLAVWGAYLMTRDVTDGEVFQSFMHNILLPIHEAGHVLFMPFGEFLTIAGGSLFQVLLPLAIGVAFLRKNRDPFGAAVCLWWAGISLIDLAPYIYDALHPQLTLLGGHTGEDGPHDWIYLFETLGGLQHAQAWGRFVRMVGALLAMGALGWAGLVLRRAYRARSD